MGRVVKGNTEVSLDIPGFFYFLVSTRSCYSFFEVSTNRPHPTGYPSSVRGQIGSRYSIS